jgi:ABC-type lipoprotein export system ATPase subunit
MGSSGSGKSTLLAVLAGLLRPDSGSVMIQGTGLWALSTVERRAFRFAHFGFIFQGSNLFATDWSARSGPDHPRCAESALTSSPVR